MQEAFYRRCEESDMYRKDFEDMSDLYHLNYDKRKEKFVKASFHQQSQQEEYYKQLVKFINSRAK